jgi:hypothetical protein
MVYSTCSMNPIENEAVVAEVLLWVVYILWSHASCRPDSEKCFGSLITFEARYTSFLCIIVLCLQKLFQTHLEKIEHREN